MSLFEMSISGALIILAIIVIRSLVLYKLPKRMLMVFWDVAFVRLLVPFYVPSGWSAFSLIRKLLRTWIVQNNIMADIPAYQVEGGFDGVHLYVDTIASGSLNAPALRSANRLPLSWDTVWAVGVILVTALFLVAYVRCYRELKKSLPVHSAYADAWLAEHKLKRHLAIRCSDRILTPLSYGILKPVILMPGSTDWEDEENLKYVLAHEYVHICSFDAVKKLLLIAAVCVHWFNPFVWIMYILANRDIELTCDETVIKMFGRNTRKAYAVMLVSNAEHNTERMAGKGNVFGPLANSFSKNAIEVRIDAIMKMQRRSVLIPILTVVIMAGAVVLFATSAQAETETDSLAEEIFTFPLSELNSAYVQEKLHEEGIDTDSNQYKAVLEKMLPDIEEDEAREAYTNVTTIKNFMKHFDEDGDYINPITGIAGMDITGKDPKSWHKIISVPEKNRQEMFDNAKREFLQENGIANGDTTKRSDVFAGYQRSVPKEDRLMGTWTLEQYERQYNTAFHDAAKAAEPSWQPGVPVPSGALDGITRESVDNSLVKIQGEYGETFTREADMAIQKEMSDSTEESDDMKKNAKGSVTLIDGADGPTSVWLAGRKPSLKQKIQTKIFAYRKNREARSITAGVHSLEEVIDHVKTKWGYEELDRESGEYQRMYLSERTSLLLQYRPDLIGDLAVVPGPESQSPEDIEKFMNQLDSRQKAAEAVPADQFDIDLHILTKLATARGSSFGIATVMIETKYGYIGGSASGDKKDIEQHNEVMCDVCRYYGVSQEDIDNKTERYDSLLRQLTIK